MPDDIDTARAAENLILVRGLRTDVFPSEIFAEHAWNMMLRLFVAQMRHEPLSEADLMIRTGTPPGTGRRWLAHLADDGQIIALAKGGALALTPAALDRMHVFLKMANRVHATSRLA